jgi:hypothetical protein
LSIQVDLARELHQLVLHVDDLIEPGSEQISSPVVSRCFGRMPPTAAQRITDRPARVSPKTKSQDSATSWRRSLRFQSRFQRPNDSRPIPYEFFTGD